MNYICRLLSTCSKCNHLVHNMRQNRKEFWLVFLLKYFEKREAHDVCTKMKSSSLHLCPHITSEKPQGNCRYWQSQIQEYHALFNFTFSKPYKRITGLYCFSSAHYRDDTYWVFSFNFSKSRYKTAITVFCKTKWELKSKTFFMGVTVYKKLGRNMLVTCCSVHI